MNIVFSGKRRWINFFDMFADSALKIICDAGIKNDVCVIGQNIYIIHDETPIIKDADCHGRLAASQ